MGAPGLLQTRIPEAVNGFETFVRSQPELAAGVAITLVIVLIALGVIIRRLRRTPAQRLVKLLDAADSVAVLMHPNPDPDAMGAAIGVRELAESRGTPVTIYYSGQIRHQQNRAFQTVLDLEFEHLEEAQDIAEEALVLVDHNRPRGFSEAGSLTPDIVIDHHPGDGTGLKFTDVRPTYGACASIVAEYFDSLDAIPGPVNGGENRTDGGEATRSAKPELSSTVATGLMYGIQADTDHLTKGCTAAEFEASSYLFPASDEDLLHRIANPQVTKEVLQTKATAINEHVTNGSFAIADVGEINDVDAIPQAADELIRLEAVSAVVVYGSKADMIHLSGRSVDDRVHIGRALEAVLDPVPMASAGGHARMGGGQVPLQYLAGIGPKSVDEDRARADLRGKLFNAMKGNR